MHPKSLAPLFALGFALCAQGAIDPANFDPSARPQDNFYAYANGGWLKSHPIPASYRAWGAFYELDEQNRNDLHAILQEATAAAHPSRIEQQVGDFFASGMDEAAIDAAGIAPVEPEFARIGALRSNSELPAAIARLHRLGVNALFAFGSEQDPKNSAMMIGGGAQAGLGLPERDYYLRDDPKSRQLRDTYAAHVERMLALAGDPPAQAKAEAQAVVRLETELAKASKTNVDLRDPVANYHKMTQAELQKLSPRFGWGAYFAGLGLASPGDIDVGQPEFFRAVDGLLGTVPIADWRVYLRWHLVHSVAPCLSRPFVDAEFEFYGKTLTGTPQIKERWKRVLAEVDGSAGEALGQLYVARHFPPASKARMLALVGNLRAELRDRIQHLPWMDEPTRARALVKLDAFGVKIGYPDKWIDYSRLRLDRGPYVLNVLRANEFNVQRDLDKIGKPKDRTEWGMSPPTVNAYYDPTMNEIVFPAGILRPPFFDSNADDAVNYGGIGAVIGHEMTHGFDDEGRQFDSRGNLEDWWTPESAARFKAHSAAIIRQFNGYSVFPDLHVNGELTQGENIADLGGVKIAYAALQRALAGRPAGAIGGFTPGQRFFLSFASLWRENIRPEALRLQVNTDPHSPPEFRVNGPLSNLAEFAAAFNVPEGSPMRRPPADRVEIW